MTIAQRLDTNKPEIIKQIIEGKSHKQLANLWNCDIKDIHDFKQRHKSEVEPAIILASWQHLQQADDLADEIDDEATTGRIARNKEKIKIELYKAKIKNRAIFDDNFKNRGVDKEGNIVVIPSTQAMEFQGLIPQITINTMAIKDDNDLIKAKEMIRKYQEEKNQYLQHIEQVINDD
jgi:hypothetical protein